MNKIQKLLFINLLIVITNSLFGQNYNFRDTIIYIPKSEIRYLKNGKILNEPYYFSEERIRSININETDTVPKFITKALLEYRYAHLLKHPYDSLNNSLSELQNKIGTTLKRIQLCYIGVISINLKYESYIFMIDMHFSSEDACLNREFYMFNIQKEHLISIFKIASYMLDWGHVWHAYTIVEHPNILKRESTFDDTTHIILYEKEEDRKKEDEAQKRYEDQNTTKYKIDEHGYIEFMRE